MIVASPDAVVNGGAAKTSTSGHARATEVAGRVCALAATSGDRIDEGDDIILVEAMKMELPVPAPGGGIVITILVGIDDVVAEGQVVAILES